MRRRKHNPLNLPDRVYPKHGAFYYFHRNGKWERLGTDLAEARRKGNILNGMTTSYGTMSYYLDAFIINCEKRQEKGSLAPLTVKGYTRDIVPLKLFFGEMYPEDVEPKHIAQYLDLGVEHDRPIRANREKSCLSACFTWMIRIGEGNVKINPCFNVRRNKEKPRDRYVEDDELHSVRKISVKQVRALLDLVYLTLQRPEDIITWTRRNIIVKQEPTGEIRRVIRNTQDKTGAYVDIAITPEIDEIFTELKVNNLDMNSTIIRRNDGRPYGYDGLCSMLTRYIEKCEVESFGYYDMKGKGATDMWQHGVPLEQVQVLCGHKSVKTTEIYVKRRWKRTVEPNKIPIKRTA